MSNAESNGFLLIEKPVGPTSFNAIRRIRGITKVKRVGHAGTLDPFASGLLIVALGRTFTRQIDMFQALPKQYRVSMVLGMTTDTYDAFGQLTSQSPVSLSKELIIKAILSKVGEYHQVPPDFSARRVGGKRLYELARKGITVEKAATEVHIYSIAVDAFIDAPHPQVIFTVECSKGTYIRSLVHDIGQELGVGAYAKDLARLKIGEFDVANAIGYGELSLDTIQKGLFNTAHD